MEVRVMANPAVGDNYSSWLDELATQLADLHPSERSGSLYVGELQVWRDSGGTRVMVSSRYRRGTNSRRFTKDVSAEGIAAQVRRIVGQREAARAARSEQQQAFEVQLAREEAAAAPIKAAAAALDGPAPSYPPVQVTAITEVESEVGGYAYQVDLNFHRLTREEASRLIYTLQQLRAHPAAETRTLTNPITGLAHARRADGSYETADEVKAREEER
jgi:hypothetical protein